MGSVHLNPLEITLKISEQINEIKVLCLQNVNSFRGPNQGEAPGSMFCVSHVA